MEKLDMRTYTKAEFDEDLFEVANVWVERIIVDLAERSEELWKNEVAAKLVKKAADARRAYRVDEVDRLVNFVKYDRVRQIDVLGGRKAYKEQVQRFRERGEAMTEGSWTKCWEVARDGEQEADAGAARLGVDAGGEVYGTQRAQHRGED